MDKLDSYSQEDWSIVLQKLEEHTVRLPESGCWIWTGPLDNQGYGNINFRGKVLLTHRISYKQFNGPIKRETNIICHHCDVKTCLNPYHLYQGTVQQNNLDAFNRNRLAKGRANAKSILDENKVREIRDLLAMGMKKIDIAREYGVSYGCIHYLHIGKNWRWVTASNAGEGNANG